MVDDQYAYSKFTQNYENYDQTEVKNQFMASIASIEDLYHNNLGGRTQLNSQVDCFGNRLVNVDYVKSKSILNTESILFLT